MASTTHSGIALEVLHYLAPIATVVYFVAAKTVSICFLHEPPKSSAPKTRRLPVIGLQFIAVGTVVAQGISALLQAIRDPSWSASQDYVVHLVLLFATHSCFTLGLLETSNPLWHPYLGSWLVALCFEIALVSLQSAPSFQNDNNYSRDRTSLSIARATILVVLCITSSWWILQDRGRKIKLDDESEALLASGNATTKAPTSPTSSTTLCEDSDVDSDTEAPDRDKELKAQQQQRLQESGSWLKYLKEFKIFIPMLLPWKDRLVQGCFVIIGLVMAADRVLHILLPRQLGILVEELTKHAGTGAIPWSAIGLWILYAALSSGAGLTLIKQIAQIPVQQYGYKAISTTSFRHIMGLSMNFHTEKNSGELIRAIEQGTHLQDLVDFMFFEVAPMFFDLVVAFVYVAILFDIYMSLVLFGVGISYIFVGAKVTGWTIKQRRDFNAAWRLESKVQNEAINNWQTVSHFNRGKYESERYSKTVDDYNLAEWRYFTSYYMGSAATSFIMLLGRLAVTVLAFWRVAGGHAPVGNFVTLVSYWGSIERPLMQVSYSVRKVSQMLTDSERLLQLLTTKPTVTEIPGAPEIDVKAGEVEFDHVDFSYDVRKPTLKDLTFTVKAGQTVAFVGETGGGKSTTLKMLYRYYDVSGGAIRIDGQDIRDVTLDSLRDSYGMVPQDPSLFNISIMDNIKYARLDATDAEVKDACRAAAIHDKIESFPDGYKSMVGERGVKLSGGELQRVSIARAILRQPKIVILDEATSMIDAETEDLIQKAFRRLTSDRTTFIVAHRLSTIQHADLILVIHDGEIVERGTHDELFQQNGKYVALWSKQLNKAVKEVAGTQDVQSVVESLIKTKDDDENDDVVAHEGDDDDNKKK